MNQTTANRRNPLLAVVLVAGALALLAYYFWPRSNPADTAPAAAGTSAAPATVDPDSGRPLPPGAVAWEGGIPVDAEGHRILNEAGLPISDEPLPVAKPIPVKAPAGTVVGYTKDAQGNTQPIRAGELKQVPNTPGSYAVVDMWADGGPAVVPPTQGKRLSEAELKRLQEQERTREQAANAQP